MCIRDSYENTHLHSNPEPLDVIPGAGYTVSDLAANKYWNAVTWNVGAVYQATKSFDLVANVATGCLLYTSRCV